MVIDPTDLSPQDFRFDPTIGTSSRDRLRDTIDTFIRRPLYKRIYNHQFAHLPYSIDLVLPEKGMSTLARRQWVNQYLPLKEARILVIGCGSAWDFGSYLHFQPKEIVGIDLYNFSYCWQQIQMYVQAHHIPTQVNFYQADIATLNPEKLGTFDIICSDAVFEHCQNLRSVLQCLYQLLCPHGIMYAGYGPLWYCWGGDHFSGRGGIEQGYNHLLLDSEAYQGYYKTHLKDAEFELQNGGRYIELDLFSKLSSDEYFKLYQEIGLNLKSVIFELSLHAKKLSAQPIFQSLLKQLPNRTIEDFLLKAHLVILSKELHN